jgi:pimeloyl-ACP methyl ester carboxylesterase
MRSRTQLIAVSTIATAEVFPGQRSPNQTTYGDAVPTAALNGIELYYERTGEGPRLLFVNGSGATLESSALVIGALTPGFDVLAHDQRGLGRTTIPPGPYSMADYAADALGLLDAVGWETCRVAGMSFGGMVAQELAVTAPERVERLALLCTSPGGPGTSSYPLHELTDLPPAERAAISQRILDTRFDAAWLAEHESDRMLAEFMAAQRDRPVSDEVARGRREQLEARRHHDVLDRLSRITAPTFVASGRYDGIAPVTNGEAIVERVSGAELHVYEGGHAFVVQDPKAFPDILGFLAG